MEQVQRKPITEYELLDHGIDHAQYFQGCGVSFTKFEACYTGCGSNCAEAIDDCLEQIASAGEYELGNLEQRMFDDEGYDGDKPEWPTSPNTEEYHEDNESSEMYYYVSIRLI